MQLKKIDVVIPSYQNESMYAIAKESIKRHTCLELRFFNQDRNINKGWMGSCNEAIKASLETDDSDYILLSNDDVIVSPVSDWGFMAQILDRNKKIGAIGPLTNFACGWSRLNENHIGSIGLEYYRVPYISFFYVLIRKDVIREIGLLDEKLPGGDDLDYSFRINEAGYMTCVTPKVFVWHHYGQTGKKLYGGYWDSEEHTNRINTALIHKHGFKKFIFSMSGYEEKEKTDEKVVTG